MHISALLNFLKVTYKEMVKEVNNLDDKKPGTFTNKLYKN